MSLCTSLSQFIYLRWFIIEIIGHIWKCSSNQIISIGVSKKIYCKSTMKYNEVNANKFCSLTVWTQVYIRIYVYWSDYEDNLKTKTENLLPFFSAIFHLYNLYVSISESNIIEPSILIDISAFLVLLFSVHFYFPAIILCVTHFLFHNRRVCKWPIHIHFIYKIDFRYIVVEKL